MAESPGDVSTCFCILHIFEEGLHHFPFLTAVRQEFQFLRVLTNTYCFLSFFLLVIIAVLMCKVTPHCGFDLRLPSALSPRAAVLYPAVGAPQARPAAACCLGRSLWALSLALSCILFAVTSRTSKASPAFHLSFLDCVYPLAGRVQNFA